MIVALTDADLTIRAHSLRVYLNNLIKGLIKYSKTKVLITYLDEHRLLQVMSRFDKIIRNSVQPIHVLELPRIIKDVDIIHIPSVLSGVYINPLSYTLMLLRPTVITVHGISPLHAPTFFTKLDNIKWHTLFSATRIFLKLSNTSKRLTHYKTVIVVPSTSVKTDVERYLAKQVKIIIISHGVDEEVFNIYSPVNTRLVSTLTDNKPFLLHISNMYPLKNVITLVYAYKKFVDKIRKSLSSEDIPLLVIVYGVDNPYVRKIVKIVDMLSLRKNVLFLSGINNSKILAALYRSALAYIHVSLYESYGYTVAEALMSGTPVIASRFSSCASEVFREYVVLVNNPLSVNEVYQKILYVYNNYDIIKDNIMRKYRDILMKTSLKSMTYKYLSVYNDIIRGS